MSIRFREVEDAPFASLVGESSQEQLGRVKTRNRAKRVAPNPRSPSGIKTVLQIQKAVFLGSFQVGKVPLEPFERMV